MAIIIFFFSYQLMKKPSKIIFFMLSRKYFYSSSFFCIFKRRKTRVTFPAFPNLSRKAKKFISYLYIIFLFCRNYEKNGNLFQTNNNTEVSHSIVNNGFLAHLFPFGNMEISFNLAATKIKKKSNRKSR